MAGQTEYTDSPNAFGCYDPQCMDSTWDHPCPVRPVRAKYVEAPERYFGNRVSVFLAGGITGCPDWQAAAYDALSDLPVAVFNPRRADFPIDDPGASLQQIAWEYEHLAKASLVLFWFPASGPIPQPIALYELGVNAVRKGSLVVGADPEYVRRRDVVIQLQLLRPDVEVYHTLAAATERTWKMLRNLT